MTLSSIQPPPRYGVEKQKIPNEAIFPPNPNQTQPLVPSTNEAAGAFPPLAAVVREDTLSSAGKKNFTPEFPDFRRSLVEML
jgi:hypothetical protein